MAEEPATKRSKIGFDTHPLAVDCKPLSFKNNKSNLPALRNNVNENDTGSSLTNSKNISNVKGVSKSLTMHLDSTRLKLKKVSWNVELEQVFYFSVMKSFLNTRKLNKIRTKSYAQKK
jgi:hypothetical protein